MQITDPPDIDAAELNRRLDAISRQVWSEMLRGDAIAPARCDPASAEELWAAFASEFDNEGGLSRNRAIEIMRAHGLR